MEIQRNISLKIYTYQGIMPTSVLGQIQLGHFAIILSMTFLLNTGLFISPWNNLKIRNK